MIAFDALDPRADIPQLLAASARHFGPTSYQASQRYLDWLYAGNPASRGHEDCIVARQDGEIVGCMHRLMLPTRGGGRFCGLHNHFVDPAVRSGSGVLLLRQSAKGVDIAIAPGVEEKLGPIYRRLRFHEVEGAWLAKPLRYPGIAMGVARQKLGIAAGALRVRLPRHSEDVMVTATPSDEQIGDLRRRMAAREPTEHGIEWADALVRWRYFDPNGPRHLLILSRATDRYAVIAPGTRRNVRTARLMDIGAADSAWARTVAKVARKSGAALGLAFTTDKSVERALRGAGWRPRQDKTFTFSTPDAVDFVSPAATDLGFESFGTEFA